MSPPMTLSNPIIDPRFMGMLSEDGYPTWPLAANVWRIRDELGWRQGVVALSRKERVDG